MGRYVVDVGGFESVARRALETSDTSTLVAIDEVGKMEFFSEWFSEVWPDLLASDEDVLAVVGVRYVSACRDKGEVVDVTMENRSRLSGEVAARFAE